MTRGSWNVLLSIFLAGGCVRVSPTEHEEGIVGQLVDASGAPLEQIPVQAVEVPGENRQVLVSDHEGRFELTYLMDGQGQRQRLRRGERIRVTVWRSGLAPRELEVQYPGVRVVLPPIILLANSLEISPDRIPAGTNDPARLSPPVGSSRSGRGE